MRAEDQAGWCLMTGQSDQTYKRLTKIERDAFVDVWNRAHK